MSSPDQARAVLDRIHSVLDGTEWDASTASEIACILQSAGYTIREPATEEGTDNAESHD